MKTILEKKLKEFALNVVEREIVKKCIATLAEKITRNCEKKENY